MNVSQNGINLIKEFEGCKLTAYKCPAGVWTIGFGHTGSVDGVAVSSGMKITQSKAEVLLLQSLNNRYEPSVRKFTWLNQNQYDALVSFCYNLGPNIFTGNLLSALNNKDVQSVAKQLLLYNKATVNGVKQELPGLTRRRKAESELFLKECHFTPITKTKIELNGIVKYVQTVNIEGYNYVKLRDLQDEKIYVDYDERLKIPRFGVK